MMDIPLPDEIRTAIAKEIKLPSLNDLAPPGMNSAPYKGVKLASPPVVDETKWNGERFPLRRSHVTIVPFHENKDVAMSRLYLSGESDIPAHFWVWETTGDLRDLDLARDVHFEIRMDSNPSV